MAQSDRQNSENDSQNTQPREAPALSRLVRPVLHSMTIADIVCTPAGLRAPFGTYARGLRPSRALHAACSLVGLPLAGFHSRSRLGSKVSSMLCGRRVGAPSRSGAGGCTEKACPPGMDWIITGLGLVRSSAMLRNFKVSVS